MKWFNNLKLMTRLLTGFVLVAILAGTVGVVGIINIQKIHVSSDEMFEKLNSPLKNITNLTETYYKLRISMNEAMASDNDAYRKLKIEKVTSCKGQVSSINANLKTSDGSSQEFEKYSTALNNLYPMVDEVVGFLQQGNTKAAMEQYKSPEMETAFSAVEINLNSLIAYKISAAKNQSDHNGDVAAGSLKIMIFVLLISLVLSVAIGIYISYTISQPIKNLTKVANKLALGEVDVYVGEPKNDEIGSLSKAFINMINNVNEQAIAAEKIANGDLNFKIQPKSENDVLSNSMALVINTLNEVLLGIDNLLGEAKKENYKATLEAGKFSGAYKSIVEGFNNTVNAVSEKIYWYEAMLDSIPFPISVTDLDRNVTFVNKPLEGLLDSERKLMLGKQCSSCWNANICNTKDCGIEKLKNNESRTMFTQSGLNFQVDISYLYNSVGQVVGHIEVVQDVTAKNRTINYQKNEVEKLSQNLKLLAEGNLILDLTVSDGDEYTVEERNNFIEINNNVSIAVEAISDYIKDISYILTQMASGNLNVSVMSDYKGNFIEIKDSLNSIINSFNEVINEMNRSADQVAAGSRQVSDGSQALSQGATEQASSIEELTASITEVAAQTKQNAMSASKANQLAIKAKINAADGDAQMQGMLVSMEDINNACRKISKIIKVIDEIAFQTNILALNASVEAARAGQHGKGFSVVAEEVRNLAARSASAAKETESLIENSLAIVEDGSKKAEQTSDALKTIVTGIEEASRIVEEIARASDEQANAIAQINGGIEQVSRVVQTNSSTAEESAAASEELSSHASVLKDLVGRFGTKEELSKHNVAADIAHMLSEQDDFEMVSVKKKDLTDKSINMIKIDLGVDEFGKY